VRIHFSTEAQLSARYDALKFVADNLEERGISEPTLPDITISICACDKAREAWCEVYGTRSPTGLSRSKRTLLLGDVKRLLDGESIMGSDNGLGHRSSRRSRNRKVWQDLLDRFAIDG